MSAQIIFGGSDRESQFLVLEDFSAPPGAIVLITPSDLEPQNLYMTGFPTLVPDACVQVGLLNDAQLAAALLQDGSLQTTFGPDAQLTPALNGDADLTVGIYVDAWIEVAIEDETECPPGAP